MFNEELGRVPERPLRWGPEMGRPTHTGRGNGLSGTMEDKDDEVTVRDLIRAARLLEVSPSALLRDTRLGALHQLMR